MSFDKNVRTITEIITKSADVNLVFGSSKVIEGKTVIPVCAVKYAFGAGSGSHTESEDENRNSEGNGGGGGISNTPLGLFEITAEKINFKPVINFNHILKIITIGMIISFLRKIFLKK
jgi:uncharacterized spore protein YtfJ